MSEHSLLDVTSRRKNPVPAEFIKVENRLWATADGESEHPTVVFQLEGNTLGLNLHNITDVVVTCQGELFGLEVVYKGERFDPNMLVMGRLSLSLTLDAWHEVQSSSQL